nr:MAG TPA: hypothetical protein [Crassvirales sp.]
MKFYRLFLLISSFIIPLIDKLENSDLIPSILSLSLLKSKSINLAIILPPILVLYLFSL